MHSNPKDQHLTQLARAAEMALNNAEDLFCEATILFAAGAFSRTLFLHQISMEECGKIEILGGWASSHLMGFSSNQRKVEMALASHKAKNFANAYLLPVSDAEQNARDDSDWEAAVTAFSQQQTDFHNESNARKNAALYVDFTAGACLAPRDMITREMCEEIAARNAEFLQLVGPKVAMLSRWASVPDETRQTHEFFKTRIEELKQQMPDEPTKVMDRIMEELLEKALMMKREAGSAE
jgi:AbiV family abortive infection protein